MQNLSFRQPLLSVSPLIFPVFAARGDAAYGADTV